MLFILVSAVFAFSPRAQGIEKSKPLTEFFKDKTRIENPFELRDPFKAPGLKGDVKSGKNYNKDSSGNFTNIQKLSLAAINIHEMKVTGVLIGKERRAIVNPSATDKQIVIVKEGMKLGPDQAELKAILPGGIILVERIINVYGQEEYLETVIPISR